MSTNYEKYRGKCKEMSESLVESDSTLILTRGWYYCPFWNKKEEHWWVKKEDGTIVDPTKKQYPSNGHGEYTEYIGLIDCEECGKTIEEQHVIPMGRYAVCSVKCAKLLVGI